MQALKNLKQMYEQLGLLEQRYDAFKTKLKKADIATDLKNTIAKPFSELKSSVTRLKGMVEDKMKEMTTQMVQSTVTQMGKSYTDYTVESKEVALKNVQTQVKEVANVIVDGGSKLQTLTDLLNEHLIQIEADKKVKEYVLYYYSVYEDEKDINKIEKELKESLDDLKVHVENFNSERISKLGKEIEVKWTIVWAHHELRSCISILETCEEFLKNGMTPLDQRYFDIIQNIVSAESRFLSVIQNSVTEKISSKNLATVIFKTYKEKCAQIVSTHNACSTHALLNEIYSQILQRDGLKDPNGQVQMKV